MLWTQKHVRTQLFMVALVFILSFYLRLKTLDFLFIVSAIAFVLITELFNTAVEVVVNMITRDYHPLAKIAKDVAAAAVLMASLYAMIIGGAIFFKSDLLQTLFTNSNIIIKVTNKPNPIVVIFLCFAVLSIFVMLGKSKKNTRIHITGWRRQRPYRGSLHAGHNNCLTICFRYWNNCDSLFAGNISRTKSCRRKNPQLGGSTLGSTICGITDGHHRPSILNYANQHCSCHHGITAHVLFKRNLPCTQPIICTTH